MNSIKNIVSGLLEKYGTLDPFELCECLDIKVFKYNLGKDIKGYMQRTPDGRAMIFINSEAHEEEMKYICAHELGHAILHNTLSLGYFVENPMLVKNKYEIEADKFAAEILIGQELNDHRYSELNLEQLSSTICVPAKLIEYKLNGGTQVSGGMGYN